MRQDAERGNSRSRWRASASSLSSPTGAASGQQPAPSQPPPVFRSGVNLVLVDVVVRDKTGAVVKGLTADDFELLEDGVRSRS